MSCYLLFLGFFLCLNVNAMMIQINIMQMVIRALVVAATTMINVRLALSLVSLVAVAPTVAEELIANDAAVEVTDAVVVNIKTVLLS